MRKGGCRWGDFGRGVGNPDGHGIGVGWVRSQRGTWIRKDVAEAWRSREVVVDAVGDPQREELSKGLHISSKL